MEGTPDPIFVKDQESRILLGNAALLQVWGKPADEVIGKNDRELYEDPAVGDAIIENDRAVMESGQSQVLEEIVQTQDGLRTYLSTKSPYRNDAGEIVGVLGIARDITGRKRAEEELRQGEERFRSLFDSTTEGIALHEVIYDEDGRATDYRLIDVNPAFESQTGLPAQDARGRLASELYGTGEAPYLGEYARVAEGGGPFCFETYFAPMERHFQITVTSPFRGRFATVFEDVTERKRDEDALRASEGRFRLLHDTTLQGVVYHDGDGTITSMNPAAERILGKRPKDFLGLTSLDVEHDTLREDGSPFPGLQHPAMVALRTGKPVPNVLMRVFNPRESRYRLISIQAVPLRRPGEDKPYGVYAVFDDVTERKQLEDALRDAEAKSRDLIRFAPTAIYEIDFHGPRFRAVNDAVCALTGYERDELLAMDPSDFLDDESRAAFAERIPRGACR